MKKFWFVAGAGLLTLAAFGLWMQTESNSCESCVAKEEAPFFQIFSSPTVDSAAREAKFQSLLKQEYSHYRVAITREEASYPDVQAIISQDPHRFVVLPAGFTSKDLIYHWVHSIPENDIAIVMSEVGVLDPNALKNLEQTYVSSDAWVATSSDLLSGYVHVFQKIDIEDFDQEPEKRLSEIASGHVITSRH